MLKLLKYEWKACARTCLPIYGALLLVSVVNRLLTHLNTNSALYTVSTLAAAFLYFGVMVAVFVVTTVLLLQRFYKSLLGDEGYLMFTLPVTVGRHIWAKTIIALVMSVLSVITALLSVGILTAGREVVQGVGGFFASLFKGIVQEPQSLFFMLEALLWLAELSAAGMLFIYLCIALGHLAKKHRVLMAVVWYFVLTTAVQVLGMLGVMGLSKLPMHELWLTLERLSHGIGPAASIHLGMVTLCLATAVPAAICFLGTHYILKNRLNLE